VQDGDIESVSYGLRKWSRFMNRDHFDASSVLQIPEFKAGTNRVEFP